MKILWLCNIELPQISKKFGKSKNIYGGWLEETASQVLKDNLLYVLYPSKNKSGKEGNLFFQAFDEKDNMVKVMEDFLLFAKPDVIHVWGTEFTYSNVFVRIVEEMGLIDKCVISIQGLVSEYCNHYCEGLPERIINKKTIRDLIKNDSIYKQREDFYKRGLLEKDTLIRVKNVIGRTEWDNACVKLINPEINYFFCNETLRPQFYSGKWSIQNIEKHSIFVSQCSYPIKGFHNVIFMLNDLVKKYNDVHVYTTGKDIINSTFMERIKFTSYQKFLYNLIRKFDLENHITFTGPLDADMMKERYLKSHVFLCSSSIENSPNSVGEAMILGCPVVASNVGGTSSLLEDKRDGFLFQSTSTSMMEHFVIKIFENENIANEFSQNSIKHAMITHDKIINYKNIIFIYNQIISNIRR